MNVKFGSEKNLRDEILMLENMWKRGVTQYFEDGQLYCIYIYDVYNIFQIFI